MHHLQNLIVIHKYNNNRSEIKQAALGALGSGRAGVQLAEYGTGAARERALLQAGLLQQGFGQASQTSKTSTEAAVAAQQQG